MSVTADQRQETTRRQTTSVTEKTSWQDEEEAVDSEWGIPLQDARPLLPLASFWIGDLRDGLPMVRYKEMRSDHQTIERKIQS